MITKRRPHSSQSYILLPVAIFGGKLAGNTKLFINMDARASVVTIIIALAADRPPRKVSIGRIVEPLSRVIPSTKKSAGIERFID